MSYLIDTNVISELVKRNPEQRVVNWLEEIPNESLYLSVLTIGEIRTGIEKIHDQKKKEKLVLWLEHEIPAWIEQRIIPLDIHILDQWGRLRAHLKQPLPVIHSLIAATAIYSHLMLVTRNTSDFKWFSQLEMINPWEME